HISCLSPSAAHHPLPPLPTRRSSDLSVPFCWVLSNISWPTRAHDRRQKRGGGIILGQLDTAAIAEADARAVSLQTWSAERVYERSEEHTSELQSRFDLVCRLLLEKKK